MLLDGVRLNEFGGNIDLARVPLVNVDRIEVVRGPQSAIFGSDAADGVVHIVTRDGARDRVDLLVEGGSVGTLRGRLAAGGSRGG